MNASKNGDGFSGRLVNSLAKNVTSSGKTSSRVCTINKCPLHGGCDLCKGMSKSVIKVNFKDLELLTYTF